MDDDKPYFMINSLSFNSTNSVNPKDLILKDLTNFVDSFQSKPSHVLKLVERMNLSLAHRMAYLRSVSLFDDNSFNFFFYESPYKESDMNQTNDQQSEHANLNQNIGYLRSLNSPDWQAQYCPLDRASLRYLLDVHDPILFNSIIHRQTLFNLSYECEENEELTDKLIQGNSKLSNIFKVKKISNNLLDWSFKNHIVIEHPFFGKNPLQYQTHYIECYGWPLYLSHSWEETKLTYTLKSFCQLPQFEIELVQYSYLRSLDEDEDALIAHSDSIRFILNNHHYNDHPDLYKLFTGNKFDAFGNHIKATLLGHGLH